MAEADFSRFVAQARAALAAMVQGNADAYKALYSEAEDITLANPFGGIARGREAVFERLDRAASYWRQGEIVSFDTVMQWVGPDLAATVEIERYRVKGGGSEQLSDVAIRVTCIYRREPGGWQLLHRHADPRVDQQAGYGDRA